MKYGIAGCRCICCMYACESAKLISLSVVTGACFKQSLTAVSATRFSQHSHALSVAAHLQKLTAAMVGHVQQIGCCCIAQVIEEDSQDTAMESDLAAPQQALSATPSPTSALPVAHASKTAGAAKQQQAGTAETAGVLDRTVGLSSVLNEAQSSANAASNRLGQQNSGQSTGHMQHVRGSKSSTVALLDAILNDDHEQHTHKLSAQLDGSSRQTADTALQAARHDTPPLMASPAQQEPAVEQNQQHEDHQPSIKTQHEVSAPKVASPRAKGSLRDRVRALGLMKK